MSSGDDMVRMSGMADIGYSGCMASGDKMVNIAIGKELIERIDTFRYDNRFPTRVEAMRWLLQAALDRKLKPARNLDQRK
jgi:hypothetical protein